MAALIPAIEAKLMGWPDMAVSIGLIAAAAALVAIALWGRPLVKPIALAWVLAP